MGVFATCACLFGRERVVRVDWWVTDVGVRVDAAGAVGRDEGCAGRDGDGRVGRDGCTFGAGFGAGAGAGNGAETVTGVVGVVTVTGGGVSSPAAPPVR